MVKKINCLILTILLVITFEYPSANQAFDKSPKLLKWEITNYKMPSYLGWDRAYATKFQDSVEVTIYVCLSETPQTFNLVMDKPYQFFYADRDSNNNIIRCVFQKGIINEERIKNNWPHSLIKKFLENPDNTVNLPLVVEKILTIACNYANEHFIETKTSSP